MKREADPDGKEDRDWIYTGSTFPHSTEKLTHGSRMQEMKLFWMKMATFGVSAEGCRQQYFSH